MCRILAIGLFASALLSAAEATVAKTEKMEFPAGGKLNIQSSNGEATVEGWDRSDIEITIVKTDYAEKDMEKATRNVDKVQVTSQRKGDEILITTKRPRRTGVEVEYWVKAPRNAQVTVDHKGGEVHIADITGPIHVTDKRGGITVKLAGDAKPAVDARSKWGTATSDFGGKESRTWILGQAFAGNSASGSQPVYLRAGYGDIWVVKTYREK
jgi:hypothetical protein